MAALVGLKDLHYALLEEDTEENINYKSPERIIGAINAKISPKSNTETLYADDGPSETASTLGEIELELEIKELPLKIQAALLGHTIANGVIVMKEEDIAPYVAIGFKSKKSNGKYRFIWLYKGKFSLPDQEYGTQQDKPKFMTGKIKGTFVKRTYDGAWQAVGDEEEAEFISSLDWFSEVFENNEQE